MAKQDTEFPMFKVKVMLGVLNERLDGRELKLRGIERYTAVPVIYEGQNCLFAIFYDVDKDEWKCTLASGDIGHEAIRTTTGKELGEAMDGWSESGLRLIEG